METETTTTQEMEGHRMDIFIINVTLIYADEQLDRVDVRFNGKNETVNIHGNFELTADEYRGNESTENLVVIAKQKLGVE